MANYYYHYQTKPKRPHRLATAIIALLFSLTLAAVAYSTTAALARLI